jgi:ATP-dependent RNA helicase DDX19/DBP5
MLTRKDLQVVLFSATFPEEVVTFASRFAPNANEMTLKHEDLTVEGIKQIYLDCNSEQDKFDVLVRFYGLLTIGSSIIFVKVCTKPCPYHCPSNTDNFLLRLVIQPPDSNNE